MLLHANTVVAKNVRMSVSIQTHVRCLMVMKAVLTMELVDENDGIVNDAWDDEGSLILFWTEQFHILLCSLSLSILMAIFQVDLG